MKIKKLRTKLIAINFVLVIIILISQYLFQNLFLERNYKNYKKEQIITSLEQYKNKNSTEENIKKYQKDLLENQNLTIFEMDKNFNKIIGSTIENNYIIIQDKDGKKSEIEVFWPEEKMKDIQIGDEITAITTSSNGKLTATEIISKRNGKIISQIKPSDLISTETNDEHKLSIRLEIWERKIGTLIDYKKNKNAANKYYQIIKYYTDTSNLKITNQKLNFINYDGHPYLLGIKPSKKGYITAITSVKISKDIVAMFNTFNNYLTLIEIIILGCLVLLYERLITKPIIKINKVSKEIAKQNFDIDLKIKTGDELEDLAQNINNMAQNLAQSIEKLKIANNQLEEEYKERFEIEKNKKFLLMNISHDLKTPLTVIKGNLQAMKDGIYDVETHISPTIEGVDEITKTLNEMLELTKLQNTQLKLNLQIYDLSRIVYKTYDGIKRLAEDKNILVEFNMNSDAFVSIDQQEMKKVIENLLVNGIKHSPNNEYIYINLRDENEKYVFSIENTGVHVEENEIELLFKEFYKQDKSRNLKTGGNGLGLAIVKTILDLHKLDYKFENTKKGMKFTIEFPKILISSE